MNDKDTTYSAIEIDIADYIYGNPDKNREDILSHFTVICRKHRRTVERYYQKAQEYNQKRLQEQEKIKNEALSEQTKEAVKLAIISRNEALEILSNIAKGQARKVPTKLTVSKSGEEVSEYILQYPSDSDRTRAIQAIAKIEWGEMPIEIKNTFPTTINIIRDNGKK